MGKKGGGGPGNSRQRDVDKDEPGGPTKNQLRSLSWNTKAATPNFLRNAMSALQGPQPVATISGDGRPAIPERPEGEEEESEEDEWDMGRGEEAPSVVVLNEGRHLDRAEVDRMRAAAKAESASDPLASSSAAQKIAKASATLNFSSGTGKRKLAEGEVESTESWEDVIKRSKLEGEAKKVAKEEKDASDKKEAEKTERKKKKAKKEEKKKVGLLSFAED